jgi:hypothetical protein
MTMIGIDPHKATHTAVAVDDNEVVLDEFKGAGINCPGAKVA